MRLPQDAPRFDSRTWASHQSRLSVLIPFHRDDPAPLLRALGARPAAGVELVAVDDGGGDDRLAREVAELVQAHPLPARFIRLDENVGRARARNRLAREARGPSLLFVDSGTLPASPDFLDRWLKVAREAAPPVAVGGCRVDGAAPDRDTALHRAVAARSDCLGVRERRMNPAKYVFTNNLLVRRDVLEVAPFDEGFVGWGWEDVEWGIRVGRRWPILHIDNPVQNDRLDTVDGLVRKYRQAAPNFARMLAAHPEVTRSFPAYRAARVLKHAPLRRTLSRAMERLARQDGVPMRLRELALKTYRACLYAEVV